MTLSKSDDPSYHNHIYFEGEQRTRNLQSATVLAPPMKDYMSEADRNQAAMTSEILGRFVKFFGAHLSDEECVVVYRGIIDQKPVTVGSWTIHLDGGKRPLISLSVTRAK